VDVTLDGGPGDDTLNGPAADTTWNVRDAASGSVGGIAFAGFEHLVGAADTNDTFDVGPAGFVATVDGGSGGSRRPRRVERGRGARLDRHRARIRTVARGSATIAYSAIDAVRLKRSNERKRSRARPWSTSRS